VITERDESTYRNFGLYAAVSYAITTADAVVGSCGLMRRIGPGGLEIGYWLHPAYTGRGLATTAVAALMGQAFTLEDIDRVEIVHDAANTASGGVPVGWGSPRSSGAPLRNVRSPPARAPSRWCGGQSGREQPALRTPEVPHQPAHQVPECPLRPLVLSARSSWMPPAEVPGRSRLADHSGIRRQKPQG
jgi:Acetyltransferase (GNAT) domain